MGNDADTSTPLSLWARPHIIFLAIAYGFTWTFWILAWALALSSDVGNLLYNEEFVWNPLFGDGASSTLIGLSLLSLVGVFGPAIAGLVMSHLDPAASVGDLGRSITRVRVGARWYRTAFVILFVVTVPTFAVVAVSTDLVSDLPGPLSVLGFLGVFFLFMIVTSGTEEIGWRGYLTQKLLPGRDFWDAGWAVGLVWAIWHVPFVVILFVQQGMVHVQIVGSLVGFGMGIIAMAILHTWFYSPTRSVFLNIVIHAAFNTVPLTMVLLFKDSPAAVLSNLLLWVVVIYLRRQHDRETKNSEAVI